MLKYVNKTAHSLGFGISDFIIVMYNYKIPSAVVVVVVVSVLAVDGDVVVPVVVLAVVCDLLTDVVVGVLLSMTHTDIHISKLCFIAQRYTRPVKAARQCHPSAVT